MLDSTLMSSNKTTSRKWNDDERDVSDTISYARTSSDDITFYPWFGRMHTNMFKDVLSELDKTKWNQWNEVEYFDYQYEVPPQQRCEPDVEDHTDTNDEEQQQEDVANNAPAEKNEAIDMAHKHRMFMYT